jgi:hypothetical protein
MPRYIAALLVGAALVLSPLASFAEIGVSITIAPPPLPVYEQPPVPGDGYLWTPGYWSYGPDGYFWVPGTWVMAPEAGLLWTPGYWGWSDGFYAWNAGYWGSEIGFYGGVNYGFGYTGRGYEGGYWRDRQFYYNRSVNNVNVTNIHNVYQKTVVNNVTVNNVSYNGGNGGVTARPTAAEQAAGRQPHRAPTSEQLQHRETAGSNRALLASVNGGKPAIAATPKPGEFAGRGVVAASRTGAPGGAPVTRDFSPPRAAAAPAPAATRPSETARPALAPRPTPVVHAGDLPKPAPYAARTTGDATRDQVNQRQQADLQARHDTERQALQQKQTEDHARATQEQASQQRTQALEQQHQQQTQQLQQRHATEQRTMQHAQQRAPEPPREAHRPN